MTRVQAGLLDPALLWRALPDAARKLDPRTLYRNPVMLIVEITQKPGESFIDRMIALVEGASRQKTPNEIALNILLASLYLLTTPALVLAGTGIAMALPGERASMFNTGAHGLSEVLYAFTSAANNNGSAFAGIAVNTVWYNYALGITMLLGRLLPIVFVLGLAGSLARQKPTPASDGTLPTHRMLFVGMVTGVALIVVALTYFPALALGPLAEGLH